MSGTDGRAKQRQPNGILHLTPAPTLGDACVETAAPEAPPLRQRLAVTSDLRDSALLEHPRLWGRRERAVHLAHPSALHQTPSVEPGCSLSRPAQARGGRGGGSGGAGGSVGGGHCTI